MNSIAMTIFVSCLIAGLMAFWVIANYFIYRRNVKRLNASINSKMVKPGKVRFVFSWFIFGLLGYIPGVLLVWFIEKGFPFTFAGLMFVMLWSFAPAAYPYYTVAITSDKINGATKWGWFWKRTEIRLDEIDKEKLSRQPLGKKLGVVVIHSTKGTKILTLGLSEQQLAEIILLANKTSE